MTKKSKQTLTSLSQIWSNLHLIFFRSVDSNNQVVSVVAGVVAFSRGKGSHFNSLRRVIFYRWEETSQDFGLPIFTVRSEWGKKGVWGGGGKGADTLFCSLTQYPRFSFSRTSSHLCRKGTYAGVLFNPQTLFQTFPVMPTSTSQQSQECRSAQGHVSFF